MLCCYDACEMRLTAANSLTFSSTFTLLLEFLECCTLTLPLWLTAHKCTVTAQLQALHICYDKLHKFTLIIVEFYLEFRWYFPSNAKPAQDNVLNFHSYTKMTHNKVCCLSIIEQVTAFICKTKS